jgi:dihydrofolate synthase/folylpolyglutamate synthase
VLLDGGHNPHAMKALAAALRGGERFSLVFGALADKDVAGMAAAIAPLANAIYLATPDSPRGLPASALSGLPALAGAEVTASLEGALLAALERGDLVLVTGSLYLVGAARRLLRTRWGVPPPAAEVPAWQELLGPGSSAAN